MIAIGKANTLSNVKSLYDAITRMIDRAPEWPNGTVIYQIEDRFYAGRRGACDQIIAEHNAVVILECGDLDEIFKDFGNCEDDAAWLLAHIIQDNLGKSHDKKYDDLLRRVREAVREVGFEAKITVADYHDGVMEADKILRLHLPELEEVKNDL
jgi:hypothetical protein